MLRTVMGKGPTKISSRSTLVASAMDPRDISTGASLTATAKDPRDISTGATLSASPSDPRDIADGATLKASLADPRNTATGATLSKPARDPRDISSAAKIRSHKPKRGGAGEALLKRLAKKLKLPYRQLSFRKLHQTEMEAGHYGFPTVNDEPSLSSEDVQGIEAYIDAGKDSLIFRGENMWEGGRFAMGYGKSYELDDRGIYVPAKTPEPSEWLISD